MQNISYKIGKSRYGMYIFAICYVFGGLSILMVDVSFDLGFDLAFDMKGMAIKTCLLGCMGICGMIAWPQVAGMGADAIHAIHMGEKNSIWISRRSTSIRVSLLPGAYVTRYLIVLRFQSLFNQSLLNQSVLNQFLFKRQYFAVTIFPDTLPPDAFRRLYIYLHGRQCRNFT